MDSSKREVACWSLVTGGCAKKVYKGVMSKPKWFVVRKVIQVRQFTKTANWIECVTEIPAEVYKCWNATMHQEAGVHRRAYFKLECLHSVFTRVERECFFLSQVKKTGGHKQG